MNTDHLPSIVGYLTVKIPYGEGYSARDSRDEVERLVRAYLYAGEISDVEIIDGEGRPYWRVTVRREFHGETAQSAGDRLWVQADRFSSGLYATSAPVLFTQATKAEYVPYRVSRTTGV